MKALETEYKGILFRSRLEARWAILFDALKLEYIYEPDCFVLSNGQKYTPDFYLPRYKLYIEIKPNFDWMDIKYHTERYELFSKTLVVLSGGYPSFENINYSNNCDGGVIFCPNRKYEPLFYSGLNVGDKSDMFTNEDYRSELQIVKSYRFWK